MHRNNVKLSAQVLVVLLLAIVLNACGQGEDVPSTGADDMPAEAGSDSLPNDEEGAIATEDELLSDEDWDKLLKEEEAREAEISARAAEMLAGAQGQLVYEKKIFQYRNDYSPPYLNFEETFLREGEELQTAGRHANITPDGKVDWASSKDKRFYSVEDAKEIKLDELIRLDGKPLRLPCKFRDLGEEYAIFDQIDFSALTEDMFPLVISDTETGIKLSSYFTFSDKETSFALVDKESAQLFDVQLNHADGQIIGIVAGGVYLPRKTPDVGGVRIGNTLNEMYQVLGLPQWHGSGFRTTSYTYRDNGTEYTVNFVCHGSVDGPQGSLSTKSKNVITKIILYLD